MATQADGLRLQRQSRSSDEERELRGNNWWEGRETRIPCFKGNFMVVCGSHWRKLASIHESAFFQSCH